MGRRRSLPYLESSPCLGTRDRMIWEQRVTSMHPHQLYRATTKRIKHHVKQQNRYRTVSWWRYKIFEKWQWGLTDLFIRWQTEKCMKHKISWRRIEEHRLEPQTSVSVTSNKILYSTQRIQKDPLFGCSSESRHEWKKATAFFMGKQKESVKDWGRIEITRKKKKAKQFYHSLMLTQVLRSRQRFSRGWKDT